VRWIFGKPAFPKPQVGQPPAYLDEQTVLLPTKSRASRAVDLLQKGSNLSESALREYFDTLAESLESLRLDGKADPFDQAVIDSIDAFLPYRDEFVRVITTLARNDPAESAVMMVKRFFEAVVRYRYPLATMTSWPASLFDNFKFITHELFLYTIAVFLKHEQFSAVDHFLSGGFYVGGIQNFSHQPVQGVGIFLTHIGSFEARKQRLSLNPFSLCADIIKERSKIAGIGFEELMQADFVIFMRDAADSFKSNGRNVWYPETLVFAERRREQPFEMFARARSKRYFEKIKESLGVQDKAELETIVQAIGKTLYQPHGHYYALAPAELIDFEQIATIK